MKVLGLRLANIGKFTAPMAVEGFSGGLDVLAAPNESGKSTILRALRAVLTAKHTTAVDGVRSPLAGLRPYGGGDPLIEVDFLLAGKRWRLRKQFGRGRAARLYDGATGEMVAGNADAEQRVEDMLVRSGPGTATLGLLWVGQRQAFDALDPKADATAPVQRLIEREIASAAAGPSQARALRTEIARLLQPLITGARRGARTGGPYDVALKRRVALLRAQQEAAARAQSARAQLDELGLLAVERQRLVDPAVREALDAASRAAEVQLQAANEARQSHSAAREQRLAAEQAHAVARRALADHEAALDARRVLAEALATDREKRVGLVAVECDLRERLQVAEQQLADLKSAVSVRRGQLDRLRTRERRETLQTRIAELEARWSQGQDRAASIAALEAEIAANRATPETMRHVEREASSVARLAERIAASAARIDVSLEPGAAGRVRVDGRPVADGETVRAQARLEIAIAGVGTLVVWPGGGADLEDDRADHESATAELAGLLSRLGVADLAAARALADARASAINGRMAASAALAGLAPQGLDTLERDIAEARAGVAALPADAGAELVPEASQSELAAELTRLEARLAEAEGAVATLRQRQQRAIADIARLDGEIANRQRQWEAACDALPDEATCEAKGRELAAAADAASGALGRAALAEQEASRAAPSAERLDGIRAAIDRTRRAAADHEARRHEVERRMASLEGALSEACEGDVDARIARIEGELAEADADVARLERDIAALTLLDEALAHAARDVRDRYLAPVGARLAPLLQMVFPDARLVLGDRLNVMSLERGGAAETIGALSDGTQEQIAILVRLAVARLLADGGEAVPVILDDALVYADDQRIEAMFGALGTASATHQVIVLTCRERTFSGLGGDRLRITAWSPA